MTLKNYQRDILCCLVLLLVAGFFRFWMLKTIPQDMEVDGSNQALIPQRILKGTPMGADIVFGIAPLFIGMVSLSMKILGVTRYAVFFSSALIGTITVIAIYLFGSRFFNRSIAFLSAIFLSLSLWHIIMSRYAFGNITFTPLFALLFLYLGYDFYQRRAKLSLYLAGVIFGFALFNGYHTVLVLPIIFILFLIWTTRGIAWIKNKDIWIAGLFTVINYLALCLIFKHLFKTNSPFLFPESFYKVFYLGRGKPTIIPFYSKHFLVEKVWRNTYDTFQQFFLGGAVKGSYDILNVIEILGSKPMVNRVISFLFLGGFLLISKRRRPIDKLLILWIVVPLLVYILIFSTSMRIFLIFAPAFYLITSIFIFFLLTKVSLIFKKKRVLVVVLSLWICFLGYSSYREYFHYYARNYSFLPSCFKADKISQFMLKNTRADDYVVISRLDMVGGLINFYTDGKLKCGLTSWEKDALNSIDKDSLSSWERSIIKKGFNRMVYILLAEDAHRFKTLYLFAQPVTTIPDAKGDISHYIFTIDASEIIHLLPRNFVKKRLSDTCYEENIKVEDDVVYLAKYNCRGIAIYRFEVPPEKRDASLELKLHTPCPNNYIKISVSSDNKSYQLKHIEKEGLGRSIIINVTPLLKESSQVYVKIELYVDKATSVTPWAARLIGISMHYQ